MKPIEYRVSEKEVTRNVPKILAPQRILNIEQTVLSEKVQSEGGRIKLPFTFTYNEEKRDSIYVPPCPNFEIDGLLMIDDIAMQANSILRVLELVEKGEKNFFHVAKSIRGYYALATKKIAGKDGILCRYVLGRRVPNTGRAVLLPGTSLDHHEAAIPVSIMKKIGVTEKNMVLVGRDPTIWSKSIKKFVAIPTNDNCIYLPPSAFKDMGADCDGDTVWCAKYEGNMDHVLSPTPAILPSNRKDGFSISPLDILSDDPSVDDFSSYTGKHIREEAKSISEGVNQEDLEDYVLTINNTMLVQKIYLGPVGAACNRIKLIAAKTDDMTIISSADYLSERAQQMLFDFKSTVKSDKDDFNVFDMLDILNMSIDEEFDDSVHAVKSISDSLEEAGLDKSQFLPIIDYLYSNASKISDLFNDPFYTIINGLDSKAIRNSIHSISNLNDSALTTSMFRATLDA